LNNLPVWMSPSNLPVSRSGKSTRRSRRARC